MIWITYDKSFISFSSMFDHMWDLDTFLLVYQRDDWFDHSFRLSHQHIGNGNEGWKLWIKQMIGLQVCLYNIDQKLQPTWAHASLELNSWCDVLLNFVESQHLLVCLHINTCDFVSTLTFFIKLYILYIAKGVYDALNLHFLHYVCIN